MCLPMFDWAPETVSKHVFCRKSMDRDIFKIVTLWGFYSN